MIKSNQAEFQFKIKKMISKTRYKYSNGVLLTQEDLMSNFITIITIAFIPETI